MMIIVEYIDNGFPAWQACLHAENRFKKETDFIVVIFTSELVSEMPRDPEVPCIGMETPLKVWWGESAVQDKESYS